MNVAVFTDNDFDKVNGVTTTLHAVLRYAPGDVRPRIYTASSLGTDAPDYLALRSVGVPIPFYGEMTMYVPRWRSYLKRLKADRIDLLHLTTPGPLGLAAVWLASKTGLPLVGSFHTDLAAYTTLLSGSPRLGRLMAEYMRWMYGRCERVLVPSASTRALLKRAKTRADRIALVPRGVDTVLFAPGKRSRRVRDAWGVSDDRPALLYVGRVSREKGLDLLPPLSERLEARGIRHRLVITGDGPFRRELARRCPGALFTGPQGREAVAETFASADVFVFPSRTDTAGNVVLEAQAAGLPVLVSGEGGPRENILAGESGLICEPADPAVWADRATPWLMSTVRRAAAGRAARDYALTRRWEVALAPLYQAYRDAMRIGAPHAA